MKELETKKLAVLIDTDNISPRQMPSVMMAVERFGMPMIRRAYGDWSKLQQGWKDALLPQAFIPVQQYAYTPGKNATDFALVIDAMDILHRGLVDGFAIVSSDSDFTPLALRLREAGKLVIGIGESKAPAAFRAACNPFVCIDGEVTPPEKPPAALVFSPAPSAVTATPLPVKTPAPAAAAPESIPASVQKRVVEIVRELSSGGKRCLVSALGAALPTKIPGFSPKQYGHSQLSKFLRCCSGLVVSGNGATMTVTAGK